MLGFVHFWPLGIIPLKMMRMGLHGSQFRRLFRAAVLRMTYITATLFAITLSFQKSFNDVFCDSLALCQLWIYKGACLHIVNVWMLTEYYVY